MEIKDAVSRMNEPTEWLRGKWFDIHIEYISNDEKRIIFYLRDCTKNGWRKEIIDLWEEFRIKRGLPKDCVCDAWAALP